MRKSLRDIQFLEAFLEGHLSAEERQGLQTQLLIQPDLHENLMAQKQTYQLIREWGRQQLRYELDRIYSALMEGGIGRETNKEGLGFAGMGRGDVVGRTCLADETETHNDRLGLAGMGRGFVVGRTCLADETGTHNEQPTTNNSKRVTHNERRRWRWRDRVLAFFSSRQF